MWDDLEKPWQIALKLAWQSFKSGSLPIAAVIVDGEGNIVATGRNRITENHFKNRNMAHAEMDALMNLESDYHSDMRNYIMYTTLEPCPMCMGTIVMGDIRILRIATRDPWAGAVDICKLPYIADKNLCITFVDDTISTIYRVLYLYRLWEGYGTSGDRFLVRLKEHFPAETAFAQELLAEKILRKHADDGANIEEIYSYIELKL